MRMGVVGYLFKMSLKRLAGSLDQTLFDDPVTRPRMRLDVGGVECHTGETHALSIFSRHQES